MTSKIRLLALVLGLVFAASVARAAEREMFFESIRQMGMGGSGVAITFDQDALYKNVAGLSRAGFNVKALRTRLEANEDSLTRLQSLQSAFDSNKDQGQQTSEIQKLVPLPIEFKIAESPLLSVTSQGFGVGVFAANDTSIKLVDAEQTRADINMVSDVSPMIGASRIFNIMGHDVALGIAGRYIYRYSAYDPKTGSTTLSYDMATLLRTIDNHQTPSVNAGSQTGLGFDFGALAPLETSFGSGQWGVVFNNFGADIAGDRTVSGNTSTVHSQIPLTATIGVGMTSKLPWIGNVLWAADYKFISPDSSFFKNVYLGAEYPLLNGIIKLRGGIHQGYVVGGLGLDLFVLHLDYAYFTEEHGSEIGVNPVSYQTVELGILF